MIPPHFRSKSLEEIYADSEFEIGTASVRLFVAFYNGLPFDLSTDIYLPEEAAGLLKERNLTPEQLTYLEAHTVPDSAAVTAPEADSAPVVESTPAAESTPSVHGRGIHRKTRQRQNHLPGNSRLGRESGSHRAGDGRTDAQSADEGQGLLHRAGIGFRNHQTRIAG